MLTVKLFVLPGLLVGMVLGLAALLLRSRYLRRRPLQFGQATVVALGEGSASFALFDGQILVLEVGRTALRVGDYGRLTYRAGKFLGLEREKSVI